MFINENFKPKYVIQALSLAGIIGVGLIGYYLYSSTEARVQNARIANTECNNMDLPEFLKVRDLSDVKNKGMNSMIKEIICEQGIEGKDVELNLTLFADDSYNLELFYGGRKCAYELLLTSGAYRQMDSGCSVTASE